MKHEPEEIPDAEHELVIERVAAVDVAKASGKVCVRLPGKAGRRVSRVWDVAATTAAVTELAEDLVELGVERVTVESTSDYWRIWYYLLEAAGLEVQLANARDVKNVPGRAKTDKLDAVWLAKLTEKGLLRPSFVPPTEIRRLRDYTRLRADLTHDRSRQVQRLEKLLEDALVKLSTVATDIMGVSGRAMIEALIAGQRDAKVLAGLARGRMKTKRAALIEALSGRFDDHHAELARMLLDQIDALTAQIDTLTARIEQLLAAMPEAQPVDPRRDGPTSGHPVGVTADTLAECARLTTVERLDEIAGIGEHNAQVIIAEIGLDMRPSYVFYFETWLFGSSPKTWTAVDLPFNACDPRSVSPDSPLAKASTVCSVRRIASPVVLVSCSTRAATFVASPIRVNSRWLPPPMVPAITTPVLIPIPIRRSPPNRSATRR